MSHSTSDEPCIHDLTVRTCSICLRSDLPPVFVTGGGTRYHATEKCSALLEGQQQVLAHGGTPDAIRQTRLGSAMVDGRDPCRTCRPASR
jgi:hypothetical protein